MSVTAVDVITEIWLNLSEEDFAFTVEVYRETWDVHYFHKEGIHGTIAWRTCGEDVVIGLLEKGTLTEQEVCQAFNTKKN